MVCCRGVQSGSEEKLDEVIAKYSGQIGVMGNVNLIHIAIIIGFSGERLENLLKKTPNLINKTDDRGLTPLHLACGEKNIAGDDKDSAKQAEILIAAGADIDIKWSKGNQKWNHQALKDGDTVLTIAQRMGNEAVADVILRAKSTDVFPETNRVDEVSDLQITEGVQGVVAASEPSSQKQELAQHESQKPVKYHNIVKRNGGIKDLIAGFNSRDREVAKEQNSFVETTGRQSSNIAAVTGYRGL